MKKLTLLTILVLALIGVTASAQTAAPVLDPIGPQSTNEGLLLSFNVTTSDADVTIPTLTTSTLPPNASFVDNGNGTGTFNFTPDFTQAGPVNITFYANDIVTSDIDSEQVVITVANVNQLPVLTAIGPQSVAEGATLNLPISATDADATIPTLTTSLLPTNATFTDNGDGTGAFSFSPNLSQAGPYSVTFYANDGTDIDSEIVAITVTNTNQAPILAPIGAQSVAEGAILNFGVSAADPDATTPTLSTSALPTNASFVDNGNGTGTFNFAPDFIQAGPFSVTFYATDGVEIDSEVVAITVTNTNQLPVLAAIGPQSIAEGAVLSFGVTASDADGTTPTLTTSALPTNATFTDNGNGSGSFSFSPNFTQAGPFSVTFYATDGVEIDSEVVAITVTNTNQLPVLAAIGPQSIAEGAVLSFGVSATDADATTPTLTTSALPTNATFTDNGNGTGSFSFSPNLTQAGPYSVTFYATDGTDIDSEVVAITVTGTNQAPILAAIGPQSIAEGAVLSFGVTASDADGTTPTLTTSALPTNATFTDNGNGTGSFGFSPNFTQAGPYSVTFYATDGVEIDSEVVAITVTNTNQLPVLAAIGPQSIAEGAVLSFGVSATDADATTPTLTTSALPTNATFTDNGNGTGSFSFSPNFTQAGPFSVTFYATDGVEIDSEVVAITVTNTNQLPVLAAIGAQSIAEGSTLNFGVTASDADATTPTLTTSALPTNATFTDNGNGTGSFSFSPNFTQAGPFSVTFYATDGVEIDSEVVAVTVTNTNQLPVLAAIGAQSVAEGAVLSFGVSATDADATIPTLTTSALPTNATFTDNGNGTGSFSFSPNLTQAGPYSVTFYATDGTDIDSEVVAITVTGTNQAPILAAIGAQSIAEGAVLSFGVSATDADATTPTLTTSALPTNATFTDNGNGTGSFGFSPNFTQAGPYSVTFYATDGVEIDSEVIAITVTNTNQLPVLAAIGAQSIAEGGVLSFGVSATDADATTPTLTTSALPTNATFTDNGNGTGSFSFSPNFTQAGPYSVTFYATDGVEIDSEVVAITVTNTNQAPILAAIGPQSIAEGAVLSFGVTASDADGTTATLTTSALPTNATFTDNGNGTGSFSFSPNFTQAGPYSVTFYATDGTDIDSEVVAITVTGTNLAPILAAIGPQSVTEGAVLNFGISATDGDGTTPTLTTSALPTNATFTDNGNGTGSFGFSPNFTQAGPYSVTFYATDGTDIDSEVVAITVNEAGNQAPVLATIGPRSIPEGSVLAFGVSASDLDGTTPTLTTSALPTNATFTDNGNGTGSFSFSPDFAQAGPYIITFYATDGIVIDSEVVPITVTDGGNQAPILAAIGPRSTTEGVLLTFGVSATDADLTTPVLSTSALPANASFIDNGNGTGTFDFTPSFTQAGAVTVTFYATDGPTTDSEQVVITINEAGNQIPVLAAIGPRLVTETQTLLFNISATDPDGTTPTFTTSLLPTNASFVDNGDGTGSFSFTPDFTQQGLYTVTFRATDGVEVDSEVVTITVNDAGNQSPVLAAIGPQSTAETQLLTFGVSATDADLTTPTLTTSALPANASFTDNGDGTGSFSFTPDFSQAGLINVTFYASDGVLIDSEIVAITVTNVNQDPILAAIGAQSVTEGQLLTVNVSASDADGTTPTFTTSALPVNASFTDNGDGTGTLSFTPGFTQAGGFNVTFYATDGTAIDSEVVAITVLEAGNQSPVLAAIGPRGISEGNTLAFGVSASDVDAETPTLTALGLPLNATFTDNGDGTGSFSFTPALDQSGIHLVSFIATDAGLAADTEIVTITVTETNQVPLLAAIGAQSVTEGLLLSVGITATDGDGSTPILTTSALPTGATFIDNGNGTGSLAWTPTFIQAGVYNVTFRATDAIISADVDSEVVTITVVEAGNQTPLLATIGPRLVTEGTLLTFTVTATDPENDPLTMGTTALPTNATFTDNGDGTGSFSFTPDFTQSGSYVVTFFANDGSAADSEAVTITVNESGNISPVITAIPDTSVSEGGSLVINVAADDPDSPFAPAIAVSANTMRNFTFVDNGNGTAVLTYSPDYVDAGVDTVRFFATDGSSTPGSEISVVTTNDVNRIPFFRAVTSKQVQANDSLRFTVTAVDSTDPGWPRRLFLTATGLPAGATFSDNGNNTGTFRWLPSALMVGTYNVNFQATDQGTPALAGNVAVQVRVVPVNNPPVLNLASAEARIVGEGQTLTVNISATDPDGGTPSIEGQDLPANSQIVPTGAGTAQFIFTPDFTQGGNTNRSRLYSVSIIATDGSATDRSVVTVQVVDAGDQAPVFDVVPTPSIVEGVTDTVEVHALDPDGGTITLSAINSTLPANSDFFNRTGGIGWIVFSPDFTQAGTYSIGIIASDGGGKLDTAYVEITIAEAGNQPPVLNAIADRSVMERGSLVFRVSGTDPDGPRPLLSIVPIPVGAIFVDSTNGAGSFTWVPSNFDAGVYPIWFRAEDRTVPGVFDSQLVNITVVDSNIAPIIFASGGRTIYEADTLRYVITAADEDLTNPSLHCRLTTFDSLATNMSFFDSGNGVGVLTFIPDYTQGGNGTVGNTQILYNVYFIATDETDAALTTQTSAVQITVRHRNAPPNLVLTLGEGPLTVNEGATLTFSVLSTDPDGGLPTITAQDIPINATFAAGALSRNFTFTPDFTQSGTYVVRFYATDTGTPILTDSVLMTINVVEAGNQASRFSTSLPDSINVATNILTQIVIRAFDPEHGSISLTASPILPTATFVDSGNGVAVYSITPDSISVGSTWEILFEATDSQNAVTSIHTHLSVVNFLRGDLDQNGKYSLIDLATLVNYLLREGPPPAAIMTADINADARVDLSDLAYMIRYIYEGGPRPPQ